jgi:transposase
MCMGNRGYSIDLRERVVRAVEEEGMNQSQAAKIFKVDRGTIQSWLKLKSESGSLNPKKLIRVGPPPSVSDAQVLAVFEKNPSMTQKECALILGVSGVTICLKMKRLRLNRKKKSTYILKEIS